MLTATQQKLKRGHRSMNHSCGHPRLSPDGGRGAGVLCVVCCVMLTHQE
jgi:hypothetical protein